MFTRRRILRHGTATLGMVACPVCMSRAQIPPQTVTTDSNKRPKGCGYVPIGKTLGTRQPTSSSGKIEIDQNIWAELDTLNKLFHVKPAFSFHDDKGETEAFALFKEDRSQVWIGTSLVQQELHLNPGNWQIAITGIIAHEWAHAFQYNSSLIFQTYTWETHADYLAGWYLGVRPPSGLSINPEPFAKSLYEKGSKAGYFDPDNYGSPQQRKDAMLAGYNYGRSTPLSKADIYDAANKGLAYVEQTVAK